MSALPQPRFNDSKKPPVIETKRDKYGRDPGSALERLRASSDYQAETGYAPMFHAALADLPRLASGAVFYAFILHVNRLSYGRGKDSAGKRITATLPISAATLAELCCCNVRQIQRELGELKDRGVISCKQVKKAGSVEYVISLLYADWRGLEDYTAWKRAQVVAIDDGLELELESGDEDIMPVSKDAVRLTKRAETVRPGRSTRPKPITVGVRSFKVQNTGGVDVEHEAVIQSGGCLVVSFTSSPVEQKGEQQANTERRTRRAGRLTPSDSTGDFSESSDAVADEAKGEHKANAERRTRRADQLSTLESTRDLPDTAVKLARLFDPLLQKSGARLLSPDKVALAAAVSEVGAMPFEFLEDFVLHPKRGRAARPISGPRAVASIVRDARENWEAAGGVEVEVPRCYKCGADISERFSVNGACSDCINV